MKARLQKDLVTAMRKKYRNQKLVLQMIMAEITNSEIAKKTKHLSDAEILAIIKKQRKQTVDALHFAEKAERGDLVQENLDKIEIIDTYLPKPLTQAEIFAVLENMPAAQDAKSSGQLIGMIMKEHQNDVNSEDVRAVANQYFAKLKGLD